MYGDSITFGQAVVVCLFSLSVVFLVLLAISFLIDLTAGLIRWTGKKHGTEKAAVEPGQEAVPADDTADPVVIAAAVAACLGKRTDEFVVRSIRRIGETESAWARKSRMDSVQ